MVKFLLWCILLVFCWPLALLALVLYPIVWLLLLPFRLVASVAGGREANSRAPGERRLHPARRRSSPNRRDRDRLGRVGGYRARARGVADPCGDRTGERFDIGS